MIWNAFLIPDIEIYCPTAIAFGEVKNAKHMLKPIVNNCDATTEDYTCAEDLVCDLLAWINFHPGMDK